MICVTFVPAFLSRGLFRAFLQKPSRSQAFGGGNDGLLVQTWRPAQQTLGFFVGGVLDFTEFGRYLLHGGITDRGEAHQPIG